MNVVIEDRRTVGGPIFDHDQMTPLSRSRNLDAVGLNIGSPAERLAKGVVQSVNVVLAVTGCVALGVLVRRHTDPLRSAALAVYEAGLLAMVGALALFAWGRGRRHHALYRHLDQPQFS
jgi:hypothetical protein